jgi:hypothetical protein
MSLCQGILNFDHDRCCREASLCICSMVSGMTLIVCDACYSKMNETFIAFAENKFHVVYDVYKVVDMGIYDAYS